MNLMKCLRLTLKLVNLYREYPISLVVKLNTTLKKNRYSGHKYYCIYS